MPPASGLLEQVEKARAEVAKLEAERRAAFSCEGHEFFSHYLVCTGYHARFQAWHQATERLRLLVKQLEKQ